MSQECIITLVTISGSHGRSLARALSFCRLGVVFFLSNILTSSVFAEVTDLEYQTIKAVSEQIKSSCPIETCVVILPGRSPTPIFAYLEKDSKVLAKSFPISGMKSYAGSASLNSEEKANLFEHFEEYLKEVDFRNKKILMVDYVNTGGGLVATRNYLSEYLIDRTKVHEAKRTEGRPQSKPEIQILGLASAKHAMSVNRHIGKLLLFKDHESSQKQDGNPMLRSMVQSLYERYAPFGSFDVKKQAVTKAKEPSLAYVQLREEIEKRRQSDHNDHNSKGDSTSSAVDSKKVSVERYFDLDDREYLYIPVGELQTTLQVDQIVRATQDAPPSEKVKTYSEGLFHGNSVARSIVAQAITDSVTSGQLNSDDIRNIVLDTVLDSDKLQTDVVAFISDSILPKEYLGKKAWTPEDLHFCVEMTVMTYPSEFVVRAIQNLVLKVAASNGLDCKEDWSKKETFLKLLQEEKNTTIAEIYRTVRENCTAHQISNIREIHHFDRTRELRDYGLEYQTIRSNPKFSDYLPGR